MSINQCFGIEENKLQLTVNKGVACRQIWTKHIRYLVIHDMDKTYQIFGYTRYVYVYCMHEYSYYVCMSFVMHNLLYYIIWNMI